MWIGYMTNTGRSMVNQMITGGHTMTITGAMVGNEKTPVADVRNAIALESPVCSASLDSATSVLDGTSIGVRVGPSAGESYVAWEIGIFAKLDNGETQLFAVYQEDSIGVSIPKKSVNPNFDLTIFAVIALKNDETLTVLTDSSLFTTKLDLETARYEDTVGLYINEKGYLCQRVAE